MRKLILLLLLFVASVAQAQLVVESFEELPRDMDARVNHPLKDQNGKTCAIIKVENSNTGFGFDTGTLQVQKVEQHKGEVWVYVQPGVRKITVSHQTLGILRDYAIPVQIKEATVYLMKLQSGQVHTYVEQASTTAFLIINSVPEGADVTINGEWVGNTPFNKRYNIGDRLDYRITHPLYHDEVGKVTINDKRTVLDAKLRPAFGSINVTSSPTGATVFLDNEKDARGTTPLTINEVASGTHKLRVQLPRYGQQQMIVDVTDGATARANATLSARFANITVNTIPGATISVDGQRKGTGSCTWEAEEGPCEVEVSMDGYRSQTRRIDVVAGQPQTISDLEPVPMYGTLVVESQPAGAEIWVDGKKVGVTPDVIDRLLAKSHEVKLIKAGNETYTTTVNIRQGEESILSHKLVAEQPKTPANNNNNNNNGNYNNSASDNSSSQAGNKTFNVKGISFTMVPVEGGSFTMLNGKSQNLGNYYIGQTEVTQELWEAVMGENPAIDKGPKRPVERVTWDECQTFLKKLSNLTGTQFILPSSAQWEWAARGGKKSKGYKYSGSNSLNDVAWSKSNSGGGSHPVATKKANELGIYDMSGNVSEFCSDTSSGGNYKVVRGGNNYQDDYKCEIKDETVGQQDYKYGFFGLRLATAPGSAVSGGTSSNNSSTPSNFDGSLLTFTVNGVKFNMVPVQGGTFNTLENPDCHVTLSDYHIGQTEVTQELWEAVMGNNPSTDKGSQDPIENITPDQIQKFINQLNNITGQTFKLPTSYQWEWAAIGGTRSRGFKHSGSNNLDEVAWHKGNSGGRSHPVATKKPNELGIYDMSGNISEICSDWRETYMNGSFTNPTTTGGYKSKEYKFVRGSNNYQERDKKNELTEWHVLKPNEKSSFFGFRLAL